MRPLGRAAVALALVTTAVAVVPARATAPSGCEWPAFGHDSGHSFAPSPGCSDITPANAPTLHPAWFFHTPDSVTASPTVAGGRVFVGSWDGTFYAFAAQPRPGPVAPLWTFAIHDANRTAFGRIVSSAAVTTVGGTQVVLFGGGATLYVLDAATGRELTSACLDPRADPTVRCKGSDHDVEIESSPAVVRVGGATRVYVGTDVHNAGKVGRAGVVALRLSGAPVALQPLWKFDPEAGVAYRGPDLVTRGSGTCTAAAPTSTPN